MSKDLDDYKVISVSTTMAEIKRQQKEHKALEIIRNKITNKDSSKIYYPFYQDLKGDFHIVLTQEEYDLLKEVLKNEIN